MVLKNGFKLKPFGFKLKPFGFKRKGQKVDGKNPQRLPHFALRNAISKGIFPIF